MESPRKEAINHIRKLREDGSPLKAEDLRKLLQLAEKSGKLNDKNLTGALLAATMDIFAAISHDRIERPGDCIRVIAEYLDEYLDKNNTTTFQ